MVNDILSTISGNSAPQQTVDDVNNLNFNMSPEEQKAFDEYMTNKPATGALPENAYYPGYRANPAVGNYSGSEIGSATLFAPSSGLVPIGMMDARDAAIQKAALERAKQVQDFRQSFKAPTSKLVNINEDLTNHYVNFVKGSWQKALKAAKGDPNKATYMIQNNPDFWSKEKSFQDLAKFGDDIVSTKARLDEEMKTGKFVAPPGLKETERQLFSVLQDPTSENFKHFGNLYRRYKQEEEFGQNLNTMAKEVFKEKTGTAYDVNSPEFAKVYENTAEKFTPESKAYLKAEMDKIYGDSPIYPKEYRDKAIDDFTSAVQKTSKLQLVSKKEPEGLDMKVPFTPTEEDKSYNFQVPESNAVSGQTTHREAQVTVKDAVPIPQEMFKKPIMTPVGKNLITQNGGVFQTTGTETLQPVEMVNMPYLKGQSVILTDDQIKDGVVGEGGVRKKLSPGAIEYKPTVVFQSPIMGDKSKGEDPNKVVGHRTVYGPADEFEGSLVKTKADGTKTGMPLDEFKKKAQERTAALHAEEKKVEAPKPAKKEVKESEIAARAKAAGYSTDEYKKLLQEKGITIIK